MKCLTSIPEDRARNADSRKRSGDNHGKRRSEDRDNHNHGKRRSEDRDDPVEEVETKKMTSIVRTTIAPPNVVQKFGVVKLTVQLTKDEDDADE